MNGNAVASTASILEQLSKIPIGTIIAIIAAVSVVCIGCWKVISQMIKLYDMYTNIRDDRDHTKQQVDDNASAIREIKEQFSEVISDIKGQLSIIIDSQNEHRETKITELRHAITIAGENALANGEMTVREYTSLHEMVDKYLHVYHQNWYVESLIAKVDRDVRVIGQLDEHGNDIE